jgi:hypothetical protein
MIETESTQQLIKNVPKGSWVRWKTFTAEPLNVSLLRFQTKSKGHRSRHRMLPIRYSKEPLGKGLKAHSTTFSMQHLGKQAELLKGLKIE